MSNDSMLKLYGLFKQITSGPSLSSPKPSQFNIVARAKYDSWRSFDHLSSELAMTQYTKLVEDVLEISLDDYKLPRSTNDIKVTPESTNSEFKRVNFEDIFFPQKKLYFFLVF